jgi:hypothetical protein
MTDNALNRIKISLNCVSTRDLAATGLLKSKLERIKQEGNNVEKGVTFSFSTTGKSRAIVNKLGGCKEWDF